MSFLGPVIPNGEWPHAGGLRQFYHFDRNILFVLNLNGPFKLFAQCVEEEFHFPLSFPLDLRRIEKKPKASYSISTIFAVPTDDIIILL